MHLTAVIVLLVYLPSGFIFIFRTALEVVLDCFYLCAVVVGGKGTNKKTTLYVGGLEENVNEAILHSAFIPFGDIKDVNIPLDNTTGKHRGFGFVEYENAEVMRFHFM